MKKIIVCLWMAAMAALTACTPKGTSVDGSTAEKEWKQITPEEISVNGVKMFSDVMALAVGNPEEHKAMAIGWGTIGTLWRKPVVIVYVSSDRYTYELMERNPYFTVLSFPEEEKDKVMYLGQYSGRDTEDKIKDAGLTIEYTDLGHVMFKESNRCIECRIIYKQEFIRERIDPETAHFYDRGTGMHSMYIGEIVNVWEKE